MEMNEKIIEKIKKCLELANNNPSAEEAKSAALMAQQLCKRLFGRIKRCTWAAVYSTNGCCSGRR